MVIVEPCFLHSSAENLYFSWGKLKFMYATIIKPADLLPHLGEPQCVIVDCRFNLADTEEGRRAYLHGHIPGAFYAHLDEDLSGEIIPGKTGRHPLPTVEAAVQLFSGWGIDRETQVVVYDDKAGAIAARLWWMLQWLGHERVAVLDGGWPKWMEAGYPVDRTNPVPKPATFVPNPQPQLLVDAAFVDKIRQDPDFILVDSRLDFRYRGEEEPIDPIAGHIPGAINAPFPENIEDGKLKSPEDLKARFEQILQGKWSQQAVFYCGSGVTACYNLLALKHAGLGDAKLYAGSWSDWITGDKRPVAGS